jgi:hypothetical protein
MSQSLGNIMLEIWCCFKCDEIADSIQPIVDSLDLYHNQGVDFRVIVIALKQLAENNPDAELQLGSIRVTRNDNLLISLRTAPNVDRSRLNAEYFDTYNQVKALTEANFINLIVEKLAEFEQKIVSSELPKEIKKKTLNRLATVSDDVQEKKLE